ncbi:lysosome-associated membrane glycoprotein 3 isoform X2 [Anabas testudineus]|uniref:lysosome-associated membrane glycoprotein 3 isoform X2 n=1 Tax=Anabas testudineus TaxID=64144 RepID=UPI000E45B5E9|nr:lysosome-associated membrane glycoprotein 3 isoform X2 [Anabas testudineus]
MMLKGLTRLWSLVFLAALIPGVHPQRNDSSTYRAAELPSQPLLYRPVLQPSESIPPIGTYMLKSPERKPCIKVTMGVEYIVIEKQTWYFNLDRARVKISGYCDSEAAVLSLTLPDSNSASLQFTFKKEKKLFYVTKLSAHLSPLPVCQKCSNKTYSGLLNHDKLFTTAEGKSFNCKSESLFLMSSQLKIKLVPLQMQAFTLTDGQFGKEVECWADFNKRVIPIVIGATVVGLILIALLTFLFVRDRNRQGYDRL